MYVLHIIKKFKYDSLDYFVFGTNVAGLRVSFACVFIHLIMERLLLFTTNLFSTLLLGGTLVCELAYGLNYFPTVLIVMMLII